MTEGPTRRVLIARFLTAVVPLAILPMRLLAQAKTPMVVFKDPDCGCCEKWLEHMTANGFACAVTDTLNRTSIHARYKVPIALQGCHTASVATYVIEGHVPATDVKRFLATKPAGMIGLTVPGMPASAPGMDIVPFEPYTVLAFDGEGKTTVFARHTKA